MTRTPAPRRVVVIGAGVVGVCCAMWLQRSGHHVTLVDGKAPGSGASHGNACTLAVYGCIPLNHPTLWRRLPGLWLGRNRVLSVNPRYALRHLPWFMQFLHHCGRTQVAHTTDALATLLAHAWDGLAPLVAAAECEALMAAEGCLFAYPSEAAYAADRDSLRVRRDHGVMFDHLDRAALRRLEPHLKADFVRGVLFHQARNVRDPRALVERLFAHLRRHGGAWHPHHASAIRHGRGAVEVVLAGGERVAADTVVVAAGAFAKRIGGCAAARLPLEAERGYHVEFPGAQHLVNRPVHWVGSGFYAVPTTDALRCAGTVEFAGLGRRENPRHTRYMERMARRMFALPPAPPRTWLGHRPTFPDALPVIGRSRPSRDILFALGHQHLGLTLAGITGRLIAEWVDQRPTTVDLAPFAVERFG